MTAEVPCDPAITVRGVNANIAAITMSATRCEISWLAYTTGAGSCAFTTEPGGAVTVTGRQQPELGGIRLFGSAIIFSAQNTPEAVTVSGAFIGPATCGSEPAKSATIVSPRLMMRSFTVNVSSSTSPGAMTPSPSKTSENSASPSGSARNAARIMVSE